jgi:hypothetical protein
VVILILIEIISILLCYFNSLIFLLIVDLVEEKKERKRKKSPMRNVNLSMKKIQFINKRRSNSVENSENYFTVENYKRQNYLVLAASVLFFLTLGIFIAVLQNK